MKNFQQLKKKLLLPIISLLFPITILSQAQEDRNLNTAILDLSIYISSPDFHEMLSSKNHLELVDTLYSEAVAYFNGDKSEALLALTFACLPYNIIPITLPIINSVVNIPLPSPPQKLFKEKNKNLPSHLFPDSPANEFGDKDKLAHFFGNAFLSYNISFFNLSKFMGIFVEVFEESLKVEGNFDLRDIKANYLGALFGQSLLNNEQIFPSKVLCVYSLIYFKINL